MKFDTPATSNPIDQLKVVGRPTTRIEGPLKTTGRAPYAYERHDVAPNQAYGHVLGAGIGKGRVVSMETDAARAAPGVIAIVTTLDMAQLPKGKMNTAFLFGGAEIQHYHQAIAVVVAESFEQARDAAGLIRVEYARGEGRFDLTAARPQAKPVDADGKQASAEEADERVGDFEGAFARAEVTLDESYTTPDESHAMMEPHATIAAWDGGKLTIWTSTQMVAWWRRDLAITLGLKPEDVRVDSPYIGGGFGGKLFLRADAVMAALGARRGGEAREAGAGAAAGREQHHASPRHHPAHPHRRRARRAYHRHRA